MSRLTKQHPSKPLLIAYGLDHATGWFYTVFDLEADDEDDDVLEDKNSMFDGLSNGELLEKLQEFDADEFHIYRVAMDLDPQP
jgi:hypothetical protein